MAKKKKPEPAHDYCIFTVGVRTQEGAKPETIGVMTSRAELLQLVMESINYMPGKKRSLPVTFVKKERSDDGRH